MSVRNRWAMAFNQFFRQTKSLTKNRSTFIGEDHLGNRYFETERPHHSRPIQRHFEKKSYDGITDIVDIGADVPPAWDAWLRFRRKEPPSDLEVKESEEYLRIMQAKSEENKTPEPDNTKGILRKPFPKLPHRGSV